MRFFLFGIFAFAFLASADAQPFIGKTEFYIKGNVHNKYIYGIKATNGERQLLVSDDSAQYDYYFNAAHTCYKSIYTPHTDLLLQQSIAGHNASYKVIKKGEKWLLREDGLTVVATLEYSTTNNQFILVYRKQSHPG